MTTDNDSLVSPLTISPPAPDMGRSARMVTHIFKSILAFILACALFSAGYWIFASDRYVSEASVLVQNTENASMPMTTDIISLVSGLGGANKADQLLLREHLLSVDMLKKLDAALGLRAHYASKEHDFISRLWWQDISLEWFHYYYLMRVAVTYDEYAGVLHISAQAFDEKMAYAIATMLVQEGERFMNEMSHKLAQAQVNFLNTQVAESQENLFLANKHLLAFQNSKGMTSPAQVVKSHMEIIASLEGERTTLQTKLASLPASLEKHHPAKKSLQQALRAVEQQIANERAKLASIEGKPLNALVEEERWLELDAGFKQDIYKASLAALERGRMDAARAIKQVSVLQLPTVPEYAMEPRRIYGVIATLCVTLLIVGVVHLLKAVILDHVD